MLIGVPSAATQDIFDPASGRLLADNNAGGQPQHTYIYLNGIPIALVSGFSSINYVLSDQLGQPQNLVDGFATLTWDRISDAFGATASQAKGLSTAIALRFPGQEYDAITGLHYSDQRDYDPTLGRYIQPDPIGLAGGINPYTYADGNPLTQTDPYGLFAPNWHRDITNAALGYGGSMPGLDDLVAGVDFLPGSQDPQNAFWHAMSDGLTGQSPSEAAALRKKTGSELIFMRRTRSVAAARLRSILACRGLAAILFPTGCRFAAASRVRPEFGIATECGFGRRAPDTVRRLLDIHAEAARE